MFSVQDARKRKKNAKLVIPEEVITTPEDVGEQKEAEPENELRYQKLLRLMINRNTLSMFRAPVGLLTLL